MKKKVVFATGSRADYGIVRKYLSLLNNDKNIDLRILVTGALLDKKYGYQVNLIKEDGFIIDYEAKLPLQTNTNLNIISSMSVALNKFGSYFEKNKPNLLVLLGDRYEIFSIAIAASINRIPILHLHGGEATYANYDEFIRHSITKMSLYHFVSTEEYRNRVIQLGEEPKRVFNLGALGAENCLSINKKNVSKEVKSLKNKKYIVILYHPETLTNYDASKEIKELLKGLLKVKDYKKIFIGTNADTQSNIIRKQIKEFVKKENDSSYFENLNPDSYHELVKNAFALVGNSSSGIIEAPSLETYSINIGHRQDGRIKGNSVIDIDCKHKQIENAINIIKSKKKINKFDNPYYKKNTSIMYYRKTKHILNTNNNVAKVFFDITN